MDSTRKIVAYMAFAGGFAIVGHTVKASRGVATKGGDVKIFLGTAIGATLLALLAEGGEGGAKLATGLAAITLISSILINGVTVFTGVNNLTTKATGPTPRLPTLTKAAP